MEQGKTPITLRILDHEYKLACAPEEKHLLEEAAVELDTKLQEIRDSGKLLGSERVAVIAALNMCYERKAMKRELDCMTALTQNKVGDLLHKLETALNKSAQLEL